MAVACLYPLPSTPKHFSLLGDPNTTHLSKARCAACISAQEQAKSACSRLLKGPTPKCLVGAGCKPAVLSTALQSGRL